VVDMHKVSSLTLSIQFYMYKLYICYNCYKFVDNGACSYRSNLNTKPISLFVLMHTKKHAQESIQTSLMFI
jgi:hypothetical protein